MTHLGKGLAAAETVNLHFVEAGDLHRGAEEQRPAFQSRTLQCTQAPESQGFLGRLGGVGPRRWCWVMTHFRAPEKAPVPEVGKRRS